MFKFKEKRQYIKDVFKKYNLSKHTEIVKFLKQKKVDITPQAVHYWFSGKSIPHVSSAFIIKELTGGELTIKDWQELKELKTNNQ